MELPSRIPQTAPATVTPRRVIYPRGAPRRSAAGNADELSRARQLRALPWLVVMLWMGAMLTGVFAEHMISRAFQ